MNNEFIKKVIVNEHDVDSLNRLKFSSIFTFIEKASSDHVDTINCGGLDLIKKGLAWVVARSSVEFIRLPNINEELTIKTWPGNNMKFIYPRYTLFLDNKGNEIGKANVLWSIVDLKNHNIVMSPEKVVKYFKVNDKVNKLIDNPISLKFEELKNYKKYKVVDKDIDINNHVNNAKYLDWIYNIIDKDYFNSHSVKSVIINYQHEILLNDEVILNYELVNDKLLVKGSVDNKLCFMALINF